MKICNSSAKGARWICRDCGARPAFQASDNPDRLDVSVGSPDESERRVLSCHVGVGGRLGRMQGPVADLRVAG